MVYSTSLGGVRFRRGRFFGVVKCYFVNPHSYENILIPVLIAAVECQGLLELFPKLRRIVGIALQRNDKAAGWTPEMIEIVKARGLCEAAII